MYTKHNQKGFTLIEMLVYLGLFALIMTGAFAGAYQLIQHNSRTRVQVVESEEAQFLLRKIEWLLIDGHTIARPEVDTAESMFEIDDHRLIHRDERLLLNGKPLSSNRVSVTAFRVERSNEELTIGFMLNGEYTATTTYPL